MFFYVGYLSGPYGQLIMALWSQLWGHEVYILPALHYCV